MKKTRMPNPVKRLGYIKCYSSSRARSVNALAILWDTTLSCPKRAKTMLERQKGYISLTDQQFYYLQVFQRLYQPEKED